MARCVLLGKGNADVFIKTLESQYPHKNSPNLTPQISFKNKLREFVKRSKHFAFPLVIITSILMIFSLDYVLKTQKR